jgi:hypothetical protein
MTEMNSIQIIGRLRKKWIFHSVLADFLMALGIAFLFFVLTNKFFETPVWWSLLVFSFLFLLLLLLHASWRTTAAAIAQLLNQTYPQLQESSGLILQPFTSLNVLEQLQYKKTEAVLEGIATVPQIEKKRNSAILIFVLMAIIGISINWLPFHFKKDIPGAGIALKQTGNTKAEKILPQVKDVAVTIQPPAYMSKRTRVQDKFNLTIEEGASVNWQLHTNQPVHFLYHWRYTRRIHRAVHGAWTGHFRVQVFTR